MTANDVNCIASSCEKKRTSPSNAVRVIIKYIGAVMGNNSTFDDNESSCSPLQNGLEEEGAQEGIGSSEDGRFDSISSEEKREDRENELPKLRI